MQINNYPNINPRHCHGINQGHLPISSLFQIYFGPQNYSECRNDNRVGMSVFDFCRIQSYDRNCCLRNEVVRQVLAKHCSSALISWVLSPSLWKSTMYHLTSANVTSSVSVDLIILCNLICGWHQQDAKVLYSVPLFSIFSVCPVLTFIVSRVISPT